MAAAICCAQSGPNCELRAGTRALPVYSREGGGAGGCCMYNLSGAVGWLQAGHDGKGNLTVAPESISPSPTSHHLRVMALCKLRAFMLLLLAGAACCLLRGGCMTWA